jgi:ribosomal protein L7/L12
MAISSLLVVGLLALLILAVIVRAAIAILNQAKTSRPLDVPHADRNAEERELVQILTAIGKIDAIKAYRERHKCALKDAAQAIDCLQATGKLPVAGAAIASAASTPRLSEEEEERILLPILDSEGKIAAIKRYREMSGSSLADAKARIEFLEERAPLLRGNASEVMPGEIPDELNGRD